jgi:flagellar assembly protein FliH
MLEVSSLVGNAHAADIPAFEEARRRGYEQGYTEGLEQGRIDAAEVSRCALEERRAEFEQITAMLHTLIERLEQAFAQSLHEIEHRLVAAAFQLTEALLQRELELAASPGRDGIARALALTSARAPVVARLNPDDARVLEETGIDLDRDLAVVPDPALGRGDCVLEVEATEIDARLATALGRVRETLGAMP